MELTNNIVELHIPCESCGSSDAKCVYEDGHGFCYSCETYFPSSHSVDEQVYTFEYLPWRGIDKSSYQFYGAKTKIDMTGKPLSIGFEYPNGAVKVRQLEKKAFYSVKSPTGQGITNAGLFGKNLFSAGSNRSIVITEGELDALSLWQVLRTPVVSVQSASSASRDCSVDRAYLNAFERIYLAFDADRPGREAITKVAKLFDPTKLYVIRPTRFKDANEYVRNGAGEELRQLFWNAKKYSPEWIVSTFQEFKEILEEETKVGIPYPFPTLNFMTYGIRTGESVLITAMEGVGKTELMHAIEHQLLKETNDNVAGIFLEEPKRRHLQALAGLQIGRPVHLPDSSSSDGEVYGALTDLVRSEDRLHVYSHFGSDDPESLLDTIRFLVVARDCRYVLLDHITMAVSGLGGEDERRALDYLSTRLEMMVKELNFALIFVSHVNDQGLTRGSRNISKICDIRIDLHRDLTSPDPVTRNTTRMVVSKNRFCGRTGPAGDLVFDPITYTLKEFLEAANDNHSNHGTKTLVA